MSNVKYDMAGYLNYLANKEDYEAYLACKEANEDVEVSNTSFISCQEILAELRDERDRFISYGTDPYNDGVICGLNRAIERIMSCSLYDPFLEPKSAMEHFDEIEMIVDLYGDKTLNELFDELENKYNARDYFGSVLISCFIDAFTEAAYNKSVAEDIVKWTLSRRKSRKQ